MIDTQVHDSGLGDADDDDFDDVVEAYDSQLPDNRYLDRELSWLAFNQRVLELAEDPNLPTLERANFLAIFASNLDEFFMVRVAGLKRRILTGLAVPTNVGRAPLDVLADLATSAHALQERHAAVWSEQVRPALADAGIEVVSWAELSDPERSTLYDYFSAQVFPVLMPLAVDPAHPFPYISGLSLNLAVRIRNARTGRQEFARLKVPPMLPRLIEVAKNGSTVRYLPIEELISENLDDLFPGMEILEHHTFRLTRNEDVVIEEDETENLIQALEAELLRRRFGPPIRLEITEDMDEVTLSLLLDELDITENDVYRLPAPLDLRGLFSLSQIERPDLRYPAHVPKTSTPFQPAEQNGRADIFAAIRKEDVLVHHPYESFTTSVVSFLQQAARDPHVLAIKQTLYRTSGDSPIVEALIDAAENSKQVLALVEVKARFDEAANIVWARKLEKAGVHVVYGLVGLKTHCKLLHVIREEDGVLRSYSHIGTGNYNPKTSRIYEDYGLFTANEQVGRDLTRLFNELSGYAIEKKFKRLLVAPLHLRKGLLRHIDGERRNALAGKPAKRTGVWATAGRWLAPDSLVNIGKISDTYAPMTTFTDEFFAGYRAINADLPRLVKEWSHTYGLPYTDAQLDAAVKGFLARNRTIIDGNTGEPHRGITGRIDTYEPVYSAEDFRQFVREELPKIFAESGAIFVYATTEPSEALLLGGNTATLSEGRITQFGETIDVYRRPADLLTAKTFADPPLNTIALVKRGGSFELDGQSVLTVPTHLAGIPDGAVTVAFHPHHLSLSSLPSALPMRARTLVSEIAGSESFIHVEYGTARWVCLAHGIHDIDPDREIDVFIDTRHLMAFGADGKALGAPAELAA